MRAIRVSSWLTAAVLVPAALVVTTSSPAQAAGFAPADGTYVVDTTAMTITGPSTLVTGTDVDGVAHLTGPQLADYLSMVSLAQLDPRGEIAEFPTILNVLDNPAVADSMTDWDLAFLEALYRDDRALRRNPAVLASGIASDLARGLRAEQEAAPEN